MAKRGWREKVSPGIYKAHRVSCLSSDDQKKRRCDCPFSIAVPGEKPGSTRFVTVNGSLADAKSEKHRLQSLGRIEVQEVEEVQTLHSFAKAWLKAGERQWAPGTFDNRERAYRLRIAKRFANRPLDSITKGEIEAWAAELLGQGDGRRAVEHAVEALKAMLGAGLQVNPALGVKLPPRQVQERTTADRVIGQAESSRLLEVCSLRDETIIRAALEAGLRRGEIAGLQWQDIQGNRILIRRSIYQDKKGKHIRLPKMGKVGRVAISDEFKKRLLEWQLESGGREGDWVWPGRDGCMSPSSITHLVAKLEKRAGLVDAKGRHIAHLHGLRHSAGSIALSNGVPLTVVAAQLRHAKPDFTARTYTHILGDDELDRFALAHTLRPTLRPNGEDGENGLNKAVSG